MGLRSAFRALWSSESKASATGSIAAVTRVGAASWGDRTYVRFAEDAYRRNAIAYACINRIASSVASVPLFLMNGPQELEAHPLLDLLARPNPGQGGKKFIEQLVSYLLIAGECYVERVDTNGKPVELYNLRPDRMTMKIGNTGQPVEYMFTVNQRSVTFPVDIVSGQSPILHIRSFHPTDDYRGLSPVEAALYDVESFVSSKAYNKALLDNSGSPSGLLVTEKPVAQAQFDRLKQQIDETFTGPRNAGRPMILDDGMKWEQMGLSPRDMMFQEGQRENSRAIALVFGVPPMVLGIPGDNTYSNYAEANLAFWRQTVLPMAEMIIGELNAWFSNTYPGLTIEADLDGIPALATERQVVWDKVAAADFLTINEKREALGYDKVEGGDTILVQSSLLPLGEDPLPNQQPAADGDPRAQSDVEDPDLPADDGDDRGGA